MLDEHGVGALGPHANAVIVRELTVPPDDVTAAGPPRARVELWNLSDHPARYVPSGSEDGALTGVVLSVPAGLVLLVREATGVAVDRRTNQPNVVTCTLTARRALVAFTARPSGPAEA
jgi:hypothetical protein